MLLKNKENGFSLVELIVVITILAILGTIAFTSFQGYTSTSRDAKRINDSKIIEKVLSLYFSKENIYPLPTDGEEVVYNGSETWIQGTFGAETRKELGTKANISEIPYDPLDNIEYSYSVLNTKKEYELSVVLESETAKINTKNINSFYTANAGNITPISYVGGNYNGEILRVNTGGIDYVLAVPSIIKGQTNENELINIINEKKLVLKNSNVLPASYSGSDYFTEKLPNEPIVNLDKIVVFSGSINTLKDPSNDNLRQIFIENIQLAYSGTYSALKNDTVKKVLDLKETDIGKIDNFAINIINTSLGGDIKAISYDIINGSCGSATGSTFPDNPPTENLCNSGTTTTPTLSGSIYSWKCLGINGGNDVDCNALRTNCLPKPNYSNAIFITGIPNQINQQWQNTDPNSACYYSCTNGYLGDDCSKQIVHSYTQTYFDGCYGGRYVRPTGVDVTYKLDKSLTYFGGHNGGFLCIYKNGTYCKRYTIEGDYYVWDFSKSVYGCSSPARDLCRYSSYRCGRNYLKKYTFDVYTIE